MLNYYWPYDCALHAWGLTAWVHYNVIPIRMYSPKL